MSEIRERIEMLANSLGGPQLGLERAIFIERLEAFAKTEQIKGMEAVSSQMKKVAFLYGNDKWRQRMELTEMAEWIDAEIAKLKEGGHD